MSNQSTKKNEGATDQVNRIMENVAKLTPDQLAEAFAQLMTHVLEEGYTPDSETYQIAEGLLGVSHEILHGAAAK